jgi:hypothetical protein
MREHRNHLIAIVEIGRNGVTADGQRRFYGDADVDEAVRVLEQLLARFQAAGELRPDFDPGSSRWRSERRSTRCRPGSLSTRTSTNYAREIATTFHLATRIGGMT